MPVFQIQALPLPEDSPSPTHILKSLCAHISSTCKIDLEHISATWSDLQPGHYISGSYDESQTTSQSHPMIVHLTCFDQKDPEKIDLILRQSGTYLEDALNLPGGVFILYHCANAGHVFSHGQVIY